MGTWQPPNLAPGYDEWQVPTTGDRTHGTVGSNAYRDLLVIMPDRPIPGSVSVLGYRNVVVLGGNVKIQA